MANELLKNANGEFVPQMLADGASISAGDLNGDDSQWVLLQDLAQGGGSTLQDVVDQLQNGSFEIGTISDAIALEADDGNGTFGEIYRTNNALHTYLAGQASNISVDLETDNIGIATETTLSNIASALESNGGDTLQVEQQSPVALEADDGGGTVGEIYRTNNALHTYLAGQASNVSVDLQADNIGLATETTLSNIASALASNGGDTLQVEQQSPVILEADDGGGNVAEIQRNSNALQTSVEAWNGGVLNVQEDSPLDVSATEVDVDINSQTLTRLSSNLEADDGTGTYGEVQRTNNALNSYLTGQNTNISVDLETDNVGVATETTLSNIASALASNGGDTLQVEQQTPVQLEDSGGTNIDPATSTDVENVGSAIGDETTASENADSTTAATVIERLSALVDALNEGQADDELRVDLAADSLTGDVDVNINNQNGPIEAESSNAEGFIEGVPVSSGGNETVDLSQAGAESLSGLVERSSNPYDVEVDWLNSPGGSLVIRETVASNVSGGTQTTLDLPARSPYATVRVADAGSDSGTVQATFHLR